MRLNKIQKYLIIYFVATTIYWIWLQSRGTKDNNFNYMYSFLFSLMPLIGGLIGIYKAKLWGGFKSALGRAVRFFSLGLFSWGIGSMIWAYYNIFVHLPAPYPSIADVGYIMAIVFWTIGAFNLSKASGARFGLKSNWLKLFAILIPVIVVAVSYYLLIVVGRDGVLVTQGDQLLVTALNILYPLGDVIILVLSLLIFGLSFKFLGGYYKLSLLSLLAGLVVMYIADFTFSYTTTVETFYVGNWGDLIFATAMLFLTLGVLGFTSKPKIDNTSVKAEA